MAHFGLNMLKRIFLVMVLAALLVTPFAVEKVQQIAVGENIREELASKLLDGAGLMEVVKDSRVKGLAGYGRFAGNNLDDNELKDFLETGKANFDPVFQAVLFVWDTRAVYDIPLEERNLPNERKMYLWPSGTCTNTECKYDIAKLVEILKEEFESNSIERNESNYLIERSGFKYAISVDSFIDKNGLATKVTFRVHRSALNSFDRLFGALLGASPPEYWYSNSRTSVNLYSKKIEIFR